MKNLDGTIITTALPQIAAELEVNAVHLSLSITTYLLGMAAFIPISGWLADKVGARDVFRAAIIFVVLSSVACGLSVSLPLLLQVGFGKSAFAAGMLTFVSAIGALALKFTARGIIRIFGFRAVLIGNGVISAVLTGLYGVFRPDSSEILILVVLLASGLFRSLQFTVLNALAIADMRPEDLSQATSVSHTAQQVAQSLGSRSVRPRSTWRWPPGGRISWKPEISGRPSSRW